MDNYTLVIGTHDPHRLSAEGDADAIRQAVALTLGRYDADLHHNPQEVATLLGPLGLVTRPSERIDEFVKRVAGADPEDGTAELLPGDSNSPDCNGD